jgi:hypothetical protein
MIPIGTVASSLQLQKLLYFNFYYSLAYWAAQVALVVYKLAFLDVKEVTRYGTPAIVFAWTVCEIVRLRLGYLGNLREKVTGSSPLLPTPPLPPPPPPLLPLLRRCPRWRPFGC